jgi:pimeloyl-ACP methyl ester carboxylesterase
LRFDAGPWDDANTQGRLAWALFLAGNADSANRLFTHQRQLDDETNPMYWVWRRRMAIVAKAARARSRALDLAKQLCVRSLLQDRDAVKLLHDILGSDNADQHYAPFVRSDLVRAMQLDAARLEEIHARRVSAAGADGFPLAAMLFDPPAHARHVVLAIGRPDLQLTVCDSLAAGFARAGYAFAVMDPRGSGRSLGPGCATPESWDGREAALEHTSATDVRRVFDAVAKELGADTTGYAVMATLTGCVIAVEAATLDRRVRALVLASPAPPRVELGRVAARLQKNRPAVFFQTTPSEPVGVDVAAQLYGFVDPKTSRLVDSEQAGDDVSIFVMDTTALPRLTGWLSASWTVRSAPRPAPRRKG